MSSINKSRHEIYHKTVLQIIQTRFDAGKNDEMVNVLREDVTHLETMFHDFQMHVAKAKAVLREYEAYMVQARRNLRKTKKYLRVTEG